MPKDELLGELKAELEAVMSQRYRAEALLRDQGKMIEARRAKIEVLEREIGEIEARASEAPKRVEELEVRANRLRERIQQRLDSKKVRRQDLIELALKFLGGGSAEQSTRAMGLIGALNKGQSELGALWEEYKDLREAVVEQSVKG